MSIATQNDLSNAPRLPYAPQLGNPIDTSVDPANVVGTLPGHGDITSAGSFSYEMQLDVPDGVAGMAPNLALQYTSSGGNGILGRGWALAGAGSTISPCDKTIATEGVTGGVHFDGADSYCIDGAKLVATRTSGELRTEVDTVTRVVFDGASFTAYLKNGRIRSYTPFQVSRTASDGSTSLVTPIWRMTSEKDRSGNTIAYTYKQSGTPAADEVLIDRIDYTTTSAAASLRHVQFVYEDKIGSDVSLYSNNGMQFRSSKRLREIQMWAPSPTSISSPNLTPQLVWRYTLTYQGTGILGHSLLDSVEKTGMLGSKLLKKKFGWQVGNPVLGANQGPLPVYPITPQTAGDDKATLLLDVNGDGYDDLLFGLCDDCNGKPETSDTLYKNWIYLGSSKGFSTTPVPLPSLNHTALKHSRPVDFQGSGSIGLYAFTWTKFGTSCAPDNTNFDTSCAQMESMVWDPTAQNGAGDFNTKASADILFDVWRSEPSPFTMADVNGDGLTDLVAGKVNLLADNTGKSLSWTVYLSNGNYVFGGTDQVNQFTQTGLEASGSEQCAMTLVSDFDGDGRADVAVPSDPNCIASDILSFGEDNKIHPHPGFPLKLPVGTGAYPNIGASSCSIGGISCSHNDQCCSFHCTGADGTDDNAGTCSGTTQGYLTARLADLNGDHLAEVVYLGTRSSLPPFTPSVVNASSVGWNTGNFQFRWASLAASQDYVLNKYFADPYVAPQEGDLPVAIMDFNRDGRDDIVFAARRNDPNWGLEYTLMALFSSGDGTFTTSDGQYDPLGAHLPIPADNPYYPLMPDGNGEYISADYIKAPLLEPGHDFDGDGRGDLMVEYNDGYTPYVSSGSSDVDLITSVQDGDYPKSHRLDVAYGRTDPSASASVSCKFPEICMRHALPVVSSLSGLDIAEGTISYRFEDPRTDVQGRGFLGFGTMREWFPYVPRERITTFDNATWATLPLTGLPPQYASGTHRYYLNAGKPATVTTAAPIIPHDQAWNSPGPRPTSANARITSTSSTYTNNLTNSNATFFVYNNGSDSKTWEQTVTFDWLASQVHVLGVTAPPTPLRERIGNYVEDSFGNVTSSHEYTVGGLHDEIEMAYRASNTGEWLWGLVSATTQRSYTQQPTTVGQPCGTSSLLHDSYTSCTTYTYDSRGLPAQTVAEPGGASTLTETTTYTYDPQGRITNMSSTTPSESLARTHNIQYNDVSGEGIFASETWDGANVAAFIWTHPAFGVPWATMDANGVLTQYLHDDLGRERKVTFASGDYEQTAYAPNVDANGKTAGAVVTTSHANGAQDVDVSDERGHVLTHSYSTFDGTSSNYFTYDSFGRVVAASNPDAPTLVTSTLYDSLNRVLSVTAPDGATTSNLYLSFFQMRHTDPQKRATLENIDVDGRTVAVTEIASPRNAITTYQYGPYNAQLSSIVDPSGLATSFQYDVRGRQTTATAPDDGTKTSILNGYGEVHELDTPTGNTVFTRDAAGRVTSAVSPDGTTAFVWDTASHGVGKLAQDTSPDGTVVAYLYDAIGRPASTTYTVSGVKYTFATDYDSIGRVNSLTYPTAPGRPAFRATNRYNNVRGFLTGVDANNPDSSTTNVWTVKDRSANGALLNASFGNGVGDTRTYDPVTLRLQTAATGAISSNTYTYDPDGRIHGVKDSVSARSEQYTYDSLRRLTAWTLTNNSVTYPTTYAYDVMGNLTDVYLNGTQVEHNSYPGASAGMGPHQLQFHNSVKYTYDARGRVTASNGGLTVTPTDFDLPRRITQSSSGTTLFLYTADKERVSKSGPGGTTISVANLYERRIGAGATGADQHVFFVMGPEGRVAQAVYDAGTVTEKREYLHSDPINSLSAVTDSTGKLLGTYYHEPFGARTDASGKALGTIKTDIHESFAGHDYDDDLGYINMKGRIYDPTLRRFLSPDPVIARPHDPQSFTRYAYCSNDPVNATDATGYQDTSNVERPFWSSSDLYNWDDSMRGHHAGQLFEAFVSEQPNTMTQLAGFILSTATATLEINGTLYVLVGGATRDGGTSAADKDLLVNTVTLDPQLRSKLSAARTGALACGGADKTQCAEGKDVGDKPADTNDESARIKRRYGDAINADTATTVGAREGELCLEAYTGCGTWEVIEPAHLRFYFRGGTAYELVKTFLFAFLEVKSGDDVKEAKKGSAEAVKRLLDKNLEFTPMIIRIINPNDNVHHEFIGPPPPPPPAGVLMGPIGPMGPTGPMPAESRTITLPPVIVH